jgi:hypothetical protein
MPAHIKAQIYGKPYPKETMDKIRAQISRPLPVPVSAFLLPAKSPTNRKEPRSLRPRTEQETDLQQHVIRWWRDHHHEFGVEQELLMAFPLQGKRTARNGSRMKAEGMRRGTPDMLLAVPRGDRLTLWIEMKTPKGTVNEFQKSMLKRLTAVGHATCVCRSVEEAKTAIRGYLNLPTKS